MFLERVFIANVGPLERLSFEMPFDATRRPKPAIFLGSNGSGKTNLLAVITDALFEMEAAGHNDVLPNAATGRSYFRILGAITRRTGADFSLAALSFSTATATHLYVERTGSLTPDEAKELAPEPFWPGLVWANNGADSKTTQMNDEASKAAFSSGSYCYFPSSRSEMPDWLNDSGIPNPSFDLTRKFRGRLGRPLFVESGLDASIQWLMGIILESRMNVAPLIVSPELPSLLVGQGDSRTHDNALATITAATLVLREILGNERAQFSWLGRQSPNKVGVSIDGKLTAGSLHALSAGQATLLSIFLTLLRYSDHSRVGQPTTANDVTGICIVDEIDAHMHVDLQYRALPNLIGMFPNVQFILTSHSPLFVLGMANKFGAEGLTLTSLPTGVAIDAEAYSEFQHAFDVLKGTRAFTEEVADLAATSSSRLLVWLEGETDPVYLETAARRLGREGLLEAVEFSWIGAKEAGKQTNFHSGKDALNQTLTFLRANPSFTQRNVLLLYDNDANKPPLDIGRLHVRSIADNPQNDRITAGIEHLLPQHVFGDDVLTVRVTTKQNGGRITTEEVNKTALCRKVCETSGNKEDFAAFSDILDLIEGIVALTKST
jgi:hypothetical protein